MVDRLSDPLPDGTELLDLVRYPELARVLSEDAPATQPGFDAIARRMINGLVHG